MQFLLSERKICTHTGFIIDSNRNILFLLQRKYFFELWQLLNKENCHSGMKTNNFNFKKKTLPYSPLLPLFWRINYVPSLYSCRFLISLKFQNLDTLLRRKPGYVSNSFSKLHLWLSTSCNILPCASHRQVTAGCLHCKNL